MGGGPPAEYDALAWFYNRYRGPGYTEAVLPVVEKLVLAQLPRGARLLDLCCGAGHLARALTARGFWVTGVDRSAAMLRLARANAPGADLVLADARAFALSPVHHAALSTFDSLNHVAEVGELAAVFRNVGRALVPGAPVLFDLNMEAGFRARWRGTFAVVDADAVVVARAAYDPAARLGRHDLTMFRPERGAWRRADTTLVERCYSEDEVRSALTAAGLRPVAVLDAERDLGLGAAAGGVGRSFFLARREGKGGG